MACSACKSGKERSMTTKDKLIALFKLGSLVACFALGWAAMKYDSLIPILILVALMLYFAVEWLDGERQRGR